MSKLDLAQQEKTLLKANEIHKDLVIINEEPLDKEGIDLQEWAAIFEEDQVKLEVCR